MPSDSRTVQLAIWREIVSKRHEATQPVNQHLDFIRKRFEELDSERFIWSKESILDIFLQIELSESPRDPLSSVNKTPKSRIGQRSELPSHEVTEIIQNKKMPHAPVGLMNLPIEIFEKIIETLDHIAKLEAKEIEQKKVRRRVPIMGQGDRKAYKIYVPLDSPILNSIQNFSITSRKIYQLCQPWLWRKLSFPTSLPAPMALWTEDILLRQGCHVQSLRIDFSPMCGDPSWESGENDPFYDNLTVDFESTHVENISSKNIKLLIERCPNLSELNILYDYSRYDDGRTEAFFLDLVSVLSSLRQFRHLEVIGRDIKIMNRFPLKAVTGLPFLESLKCGGVTVSQNRKKLGDGSFGSSLSKLKYLSRLHLYLFEDIDESWCLYNWPGTITELTLQQCSHLLPSTALRIIGHIAPHLQKLELDFNFNYRDPDDYREIDHSWNPHNSLKLQSLTDLKLCSRNPNLLFNFRDCKSLHSLTWTYKTLQHLQSLTDIMSQAPWPQLKKLNIASRHPLDPPRTSVSQAYEDQLSTVVNYCEQAHITANVHAKYFVNTLELQYPSDEDDSDEDDSN